MSKEEKDLLLKDLCAKLPYEVIVKKNCIATDGEHYSVDELISPIELYKYIECDIDIPIKPYLRPMSSMTDDEKTELFQLMGNGTDIQRIDFYNSHYFDYRCLIDKNLALEAPEGMYNISGSGLRVRLKSGEIIEVIKNDDFCAAKYLNKETTEYIFDEDIEEIIK